MKGVEDNTSDSLMFTQKDLFLLWSDFKETVKNMMTKLDHRDILETLRTKLKCKYCKYMANYLIIFYL